MRYLSWIGAGVVGISVAVSGCGGSSSSSSDASGGSKGGDTMAGAAGKLQGSAGQATAGSTGQADGGGASGLGGSGANAGSPGSSGSGSGSAGQSGMCPAITACGGSLVGKWQLTDLCLNLTADGTDLGCDGATLSLDHVTPSGSIEFKADLTWQTSSEIKVDEHLNFPTSCYTSDQCTQFETALKAEDGVTSATCTYDAQSGCSCKISSAQPSMNGGTYAVSGNNVTLTTDGSDGPPETDSFCVSGNTLHLQNDSASGGIAVITATK